MPGIRDKIILNLHELDADNYSMRNAVESGLELADEIRGADLLKEAQVFVYDQEAICTGLHKPLQAACKAQRDLNERMRKWLDVKLGLS